MLKAYRILTMNRNLNKNIMENIYLAYRAIVTKKTSPFKGIDLFTLIECLHVNYPGELKTLFINVFFLIFHYIECK